MSTATGNHRRQPAASVWPASSDCIVKSMEKLSLWKGNTFHPTATNDLWDPLQVRAAPGAALPNRAPRSPTYPKFLKDLFFGAGDRRTTDLLRKVKDAVQIKSKDAFTSALSEPEMVPVPTYEGPRIMRPHRHGSYSGIGSSVDSMDNFKAIVAPTPPPHKESAQSPVVHERNLSRYARDKIKRNIVKPILDEDCLKRFHPLIREIPARIDSHELRSLRDLEKTLIFRAPEYSPSPVNYLVFCERAVRVLHTTAAILHESDQKRPTERPYTQRYFYDLIEQIRRYATILTVTKKKLAECKTLDEMDYSPEKHVSLAEGVSCNGKQAELVRYKSGKAISLADDRVLSPKELASPHPHMSDDRDDRTATRPMARRKKNAKPESRFCEVCEKEFTRLCDFNKHRKTHVRPWKCKSDECKYSVDGWPTEKERDRHMNDRHTVAPKQFRCQYAGCHHQSKRESNCKQHMEKAHGWHYVRAKANGKGHALPRRGSQVPPSPASTQCYTPSLLAPPPSNRSSSLPSGSRQALLAPQPPQTTTGPRNWAGSLYSRSSHEFADHFNMGLDFNDTANFPITPVPSHYTDFAFPLNLQHPHPLPTADHHVPTSDPSAGGPIDVLAPSSRASLDAFYRFPIGAPDISSPMSLGSHVYNVPELRAAHINGPRVPPAAEHRTLYHPQEQPIPYPSAVSDNPYAPLGPSPPLDFDIYTSALPPPPNPVLSHHHGQPQHHHQQATAHWFHDLSSDRHLPPPPPSMNTRYSVLDELFPELG